MTRTEPPRHLVPLVPSSDAARRLTLRVPPAWATFTTREEKTRNESAQAQTSRRGPHGSGLFWVRILWWAGGCGAIGRRRVGGGLLLLSGLSFSGAAVLEMPRVERF